MPKVIIIEKDKNFSNNIAEILELHGYDAVELNSGLDFQQSFRTTLPDLLVISVKLEDAYSGIDLVKELRNHSNMPVLFISDHYLQLEYKVDTEDIGNCKLINKPFEIKAFIKSVENLLSSIGLSIPYS